MKIPETTRQLLEKDFLCEIVHLWAIRRDEGYGVEVIIDSQKMDRAFRNDYRKVSCWPDGYVRKGRGKFLAVGK